MPHHPATLSPCHLVPPSLAAYAIARKTTPPPPTANGHDPWWSNVPTLAVSNFHYKSSRHHPKTLAKLAYTKSALHLVFHVQDRFVRAKYTDLHSRVCNDSCVEFFVQPRPDLPPDRGGGYFNFEINCAGTLLAYYIENPKRAKGGFVKFRKLTPAQARQIPIIPSLRITPPFLHPAPLDWSIQYSIPLALLESYVGRLRPLAGQSWRGNFFKCADRCKYPHWASWSPIGRPWNFHQPRRFGQLYSAKQNP